MRSTYNRMAVIGLLASMTLFSACSSKKVSKSNPNVAPATSENGEVAGESEDANAEEIAGVFGDKVAALSSAFGLLNFRQLPHSYQALTGVTLANAAVLAEYNKQQSSLPNDAAPAAISPSKVAAATKLASQYCDVLSTTPALLSARFPGLTVTAVPADSTAFATTLLNGFYGAEHMLQGPRATDISNVAATVDALKGIAGATGPAVFMATCAAVLASAEFFVY